jgi:predicted  nucleic acid-binding Zn-ribbon protein
MGGRTGHFNKLAPNGREIRRRMDMTTQTDTVQQDDERTNTTAEDLRNGAADAAHDIRTEAEKIAKDQAEATRQKVADNIGSFGGALRKAARDLEAGSMQEQAMSRVADGIADLSDNIATADLRQGVNELSTYARRQPVAFLGAAALLGFAGARFLKASDHPSAEDLSEDWPEYS